MRILLFVCLFLATCAGAGDFWEHAEQYRDGVLLKKLELAKPRVMKGWIMRVDLTTPGIGYTVTGRAPDWGKPMPDYPSKKIFTKREKSVDYMRHCRAEGKNVEIVVNTSPWTPWCPPWNHIYGEPGGWVVSDGVEVCAGKKPGHGALFTIRKDGRAAIESDVPADEIKDVQFAMCGFTIIATNGVSKVGHDKTLAPRTAFGLSSDKRYLTLLVIDGRQKGFSEGADLGDLCDLLLAAGASEALNMDGGGSTSLVVHDPVLDIPVMLNHQPAGQMRTVAVNFGITFPAESKPTTKCFFYTAGRRVVEIDYGDAPEMAKWCTGALKDNIAKWYPKICDLLAQDGYSAPTFVKIVMKKNGMRKGVPAFAAGDVIFVNAAWANHEINGEAAGCVIHELVHVVQAYGNNGKQNPPWWVTEGIADYIRWFLFEPEKNGARCTKRFEGYKSDAGYRVTANFLDWCERTFGKGRFVSELNSACRSGEYDDSIWQKKSGKSRKELEREWNDGMK